MSVFWRKNRKCWAYQFQRRKQTCYASGFQTKREAARAEAVAREILRRGKSNLNTPTFRELTLNYLTKLNTYHTKLWANQARWKINKYFKPLFDLEVDAITSADIQTILSQLRATKKPRTLNELRRILNAIFNLGVRNELITRNPIKNVPPFPIDDVPKYIPPESHLLKVLQLASAEQMAHLLFMKNTMCRLSSSKKVTWNDISFEERWVILSTRKKRGGGERRWKVPINSELLPVLKWLKQNSTSKYLFPNAVGKEQTKYPTYLRDLCDKAGVKRFAFHSIRHYAATLAANRNAPLTGIQEVLGHEDASTTSIYLQSLGETMRSTVETLVTKPAPVDNGQDIGQDFSEISKIFHAKSRRLLHGQPEEN